MVITRGKVDNLTFADSDEFEREGQVVPERRGASAARSVDLMASEDKHSMQ